MVGNNGSGGEARGEKVRHWGGEVVSIRSQSPSNGVCQAKQFEDGEDETRWRERDSRNQEAKERERNRQTRRKATNKRERMATRRTRQGGKVDKSLKERQRQQRGKGVRCDKHNARAGNGA